MAEYFRDEEGQDVLLFIDNIFRFTQVLDESESLLHVHGEGRGGIRQSFLAQRLDQFFWAVHLNTGHGRTGRCARVAQLAR